MEINTIGGALLSKWIIRSVRLGIKKRNVTKHLINFSNLEEKYQEDFYEGIRDAFTLNGLYEIAVFIVAGIGRIASIIRSKLIEKYGGRVIVPDCKTKTLIPIVRGKIKDNSEINTDGWKAYDGLVDLGYEKHYRVHHGKNEFSRGRQHINGIESFWSFTKRRLAKFNGIKKEFFHLYLKESEFRYNTRINGGNLNYIIQQLLMRFNS